MSIERSKGLTVRVFPNPVKNELNIDLNFESKKAMIKVFDVLGKIIYNENIGRSNGLKINTLNWNSGVYFLTITDGQRSFQQKIIKQ